MRTNYTAEISKCTNKAGHKTLMIIKKIHKIVVVSYAKSNNLKLNERTNVVGEMRYESKTGTVPQLGEN